VKFIKALFVIAAVLGSASPAAAEAVRVFAGKYEGSGVHIGGGVVVSAAHVFGDRRSATLITEDGLVYVAKVTKIDEGADLATLQITGQKYPVGVTSIPCRDPLRGEHVEAIGNPHALPFVHTWGRVGNAKPQKYGPWRSVIILDITVAGGMSGGPVLDRNGEVIAIVVGGLSDQKQEQIIPITFAVPASTVCAHLNQKT
jgi:S1-C subfamily serine protease